MTLKIKFLYLKPSYIKLDMRLSATKFYCELNYIEYYWAKLQRYTQVNCKYTFTELKKTVIEAIDSMELKTIRRFIIYSKM
jgi:transposase-like protein